MNDCTYVIGTPAGPAGFDDDLEAGNFGVHVTDWTGTSSFLTPAEARAAARDVLRHGPGSVMLLDQEHARSLDYMAEAAERGIPKTLTLSQWDDEGGLTVEISWTKDEDIEGWQLSTVRRINS